MLIQFDTMFADCFMTEYIYHGFRLRKLKRAFRKWQYGLQGKAWFALYLENHDHPRVVSRYGNLRYWKESGSMLAACYILQRGTPFLYQGQELGMTNIALNSIDKYIDVAAKNAYNSFFLKDSVERRLERIHVSTRDSARTPVQWSDARGAGFTSGKPWFYINPNYSFINAEMEDRDPLSILNFYRRCLRLRKHSRTLLFGTYREYFACSSKVYMYERKYADSGLEERILVICSFDVNERAYRMPRGYKAAKGKLILDNYLSEEELKAGKTADAGTLRPYEVQVWKFRKRRKEKQALNNTV
jgi:oligo-1,6-glucosidase